MVAVVVATRGFTRHLGITHSGALWTTACNREMPAWEARDGEAQVTCPQCLRRLDDLDAADRMLLAGGRRGMNGSPPPLAPSSPAPPEEEPLGPARMPPPEEEGARRYRDELRRARDRTAARRHGVTPPRRDGGS